MAAKSTKADWTKQMDALHVERGFVVDDPGFTIQEYSSRYGLSYEGSHTRLAKLQRAGKLIAGWRQVNGRRMKVFRFPE